MLQKLIKISLVNNKLIGFRMVNMSKQKRSWNLYFSTFSRHNWSKFKLNKALSLGGIHLYQMAVFTKVFKEYPTQFPH